MYTRYKPLKDGNEIRWCVEWHNGKWAVFRKAHDGADETNALAETKCIYFGPDKEEAMTCYMIGVPDNV